MVAFVCEEHAYLNHCLTDLLQSVKSFNLDERFLILYYVVSDVKLYVNELNDLGLNIN